MILQLFAIFDSKAECYLPPFLIKTKGEALRSLGELVADPQHNFSKYAEDFTLFHLGTWDDQTCKYSLLQASESVVKLHELKRSPKEE